jgi:asparagine synthase (glutamine-hydrolysing)
VQPYTNGAAKWWLSNFTSQYVSGVLTGDGADELLCGYPSFRYANWWKFAMRTGQHDLGTSWRDSVYQKKFLSHQKNPWLTGSSHLGTGSDFVQSLLLWGIAHPLFDEIKSIACALLGENEGMEFLKNQRESIKSWFAFGLSDDPTFLTDSENTLLLWQNYFFKTHLPVQVLNWVGDRMEMANTLEGRTPFLSRKMRDFIRNQPDVELVRGFQEKSILRRAYKNKIQKAAAIQCTISLSTRKQKLGTGNFRSSFKFWFA